MTELKKIISYNIEDNNTFHLLKFYLPEVSKDDITLEVKSGRLQVSAGERTQEIKINSHLQENGSEDILAKYDNEVLYVTVPKENHSSRLINIL